MLTQKVLTDFNKLSLQFAKWLTGHRFKKIDPKLKMKISATEYCEKLEQCHLHAKVETLQAVLAMSNHIEQDEEQEGQDKHEILKGDIEVLLTSVANNFRKKHSAKQGKLMKEASVEEIMESAKHWKING